MLDEKSVTTLIIFIHYFATSFIKLTWNEEKCFTIQKKCKPWLTSKLKKYMSFVRVLNLVLLPIVLTDLFVTYFQNVSKKLNEKYLKKIQNLRKLFSIIGSIHFLSQLNKKLQALLNLSSLGIFLSTLNLCF